ncbi:MAG: DNA-3-methyladenine glycosylase [Thermoproteota archaeon]|nr:MAG: DNA-3-methyladenine glycosylase [Candidatus Korarchaeota archaeon]
MGKKLPREFFCRDPVTLAKSLLGKLLVHETLEGRISGIVVETEAYLGREDKASRGYGGRRTPKMEPLYRDCGLLYIYPVHAYAMLNVTAAPPKEPNAVLIRAVEPVEGIELMKKNRGSEIKLEKLCAGPGRLTKAFGITLDFNGISVEEGPIYFENYREVDLEDIVATKRIGVDYAGEHAELPLRFYIKGSKYLSRP